MSWLCNKWLIEIKCSGSLLDTSPHEAAVAVCKVKLVGGKWVFYPNHKYYHGGSENKTGVVFTGGILLIECAFATLLCIYNNYVKRRRVKVLIGCKQNMQFVNFKLRRQVAHFWDKHSQWKQSFVHSHWARSSSESMGTSVKKHDGKKEDLRRLQTWRPGPMKSCWPQYKKLKVEDIKRLLSKVGEPYQIAGNFFIVHRLRSFCHQVAARDRSTKFRYKIWY